MSQKPMSMYTLQYKVYLLHFEMISWENKSWHSFPSQNSNNSDKTDFIVVTSTILHSAFCKTLLEASWILVWFYSEYTVKSSWYSNQLSWSNNIADFSRINCLSFGKFSKIWHIYNVGNGSRFFALCREKQLSIFTNIV